MEAQFREMQKQQLEWQQEFAQAKAQMEAEFWAG